MSTRDTRITVNLKQEVLTVLRSLANQERKSASALTREFIEEALKVRELIP